MSGICSAHRDHEPGCRQCEAMPRWQHVVGTCPACGAPLLDCGWCDDPGHWLHGEAVVAGRDPAGGDTHA